MFLDGLTPVLNEFTRHPVAFLGGFFTGLLRLNLDDDPVRSWLDQQSGDSKTGGSATPGTSNGKSEGPQSISIE